MAVKKQIMEKEGFFPDQQCLIFSGRKLDNSLTLTDYNIQRESTIYLRLLEIVYVEMQTGKKISFELASSDTIKDVKDKL